MRARLLALALSAIALVTSSATAGTPYEEELTCPVGGEKFTHTATGSYSTFGSRPDGKPYGSWIFPMPIPVCPSNKLPVYQQFSKEHVARLEPLVASAEFKAVGESDMSYYRAAWLMERMGDPADEVAWMIVKASWEADDQPELKRKYQQEYVQRLQDLPRKGKELDWLWLQARAANGLRELGEYAEAITLIDSLSPQATFALEQARKDPKQQNVRRSDVDFVQGLVEFLARLKQASAEQNSASEPIAMVPVMVARHRCEKESEKLVQTELEACKKLPAKDW